MIKTGNIFSSIPKEIDTEIVDILVQNKKVKVERIVSKGHTSPTPEESGDGWYDQEDNEWVMVLKGDAILSFKGNDDIKMKSGDYTTIPAHEKHRVKWTDPDSETIWLVIHY